MPRANADFGLINKHLRHTTDGVSCRQCGQSFSTENCEKIARNHIRNHIKKNEIVLQPQEENETSDSDSSGKIITVLNCGTYINNRSFAL